MSSAKHNMELLNEEARKRCLIENGGNGHQNLGCVISGKGTQYVLWEGYK